MNFREKVYKIVKLIPKGRVLSYKEVARLAGSPRAWRTVGNILSKNQNLCPPKFSKKILAGKQIPCHRVVKSDGRIGGYRYGEKKKAVLLRKEGVVIRNWRVVT